MRVLFLIGVLFGQAAFAAPVEVSLERVGWAYVGYNGGDTHGIWFNERVHPEGCDVPSSSETCGVFASVFDHDYSDFLSMSGNYQSEHVSTDTSFSLLATSIASAATRAPADGDYSIFFGDHEDATWLVEFHQSVLLVEFHVSEAVVYVGDTALTDAGIRVSNHSYLLPGQGGNPTGNLYLSGDVLLPGSYQVIQYGQEPIFGPNSSIQLLPELGQTLTQTYQRDFAFHFTTTTVPIPAAIWLFGSALFALKWFSKVSA